jgi:hypothetical protein
LDGGNQYAIAINRITSVVPALVAVKPVAPLMVMTTVQVFAPTVNVPAAALHGYFQIGM